MNMYKKDYATENVNKILGQIIIFFHIGYQIFGYIILNHKIKNTLIIMDKATTHFCKDLNYILKKYYSYFILIPPGLTRNLQPFDVVINKPFKHAMKKSDWEFRLKYDNKIHLSDDEIIKHVVLNWYDDKIIKKETFIRAFKI